MKIRRIFSFLYRTYCSNPLYIVDPTLSKQRDSDNDNDDDDEVLIGDRWYADADADADADAGIRGW